MGAVLLLYDGTDASRRALQNAVERARLKSGPLYVLGVVPLPIGPQPDGRGVDPTADVKRQAEHLAEAERLVRESGLEPMVVAALGEPVETIRRFARDRPVDVVVLGGVEEGPIGHVRPTELGRALTSSLPCDVVVVA